MAVAQAAAPGFKLLPPGRAPRAISVVETADAVVVARDAAAAPPPDEATRERAVALLRRALRAARRDEGPDDDATIVAYRSISAAILSDALADILAGGGA